MSEQATPPDESPVLLTQHAMLVLWGAYAQEIVLVEAFEQVDLWQKADQPTRKRVASSGRLMALFTRSVDRHCVRYLAAILGPGTED